jgi:hypothetical protein
LHLLRVPPPQALVGPWIHRQGVGAREGNARRLQGLNLLWVIGQEPDRADPQIPQDRRCARLVAGVVRIAESAVRLGLGPPLGLQRSAAHESEMDLW